MALGIPVLLIGLMLSRHYEDWRSVVGSALYGSGVGLVLCAVMMTLLGQLLRSID